MRAVVYQDPFKVTIEDVPDPTIEKPTDVIVRVTSSAICGSDLHMYDGRTDFESGRWFGHEKFDARHDGWTKVVLRPMVCSRTATR